MREERCCLLAQVSWLWAFLGRNDLWRSQENLSTWQKCYLFINNFHHPPSPSLSLHCQIGIIDNISFNEIENSTAIKLNKLLLVIFQGIFDFMILPQSRKFFISLCIFCVGYDERDVHNEKVKHISRWMILDHRDRPVVK